MVHVQVAPAQPFPGGEAPEIRVRGPGDGNRPGRHPLHDRSQPGDVGGEVRGRRAPARSLVGIDDVGIATAFLALDSAKLITGGTLYVDGGYHIID